MKALADCVQTALYEVDEDLNGRKVLQPVAIDSAVYAKDHSPVHIITEDAFVCTLSSWAMYHNNTEKVDSTILEC